MDSTIIALPQSPEKVFGFTQSQFRRLDALYLQAAGHKTLTYRTVECDFDEGIASYTYYQSEKHSPYLQFVIRKVGPRTLMFEVYQQGKGRAYKSGLFDKAHDYLKDQIDKLSA